MSDEKNIAVTENLTHTEISIDQVLPNYGKPWYRVPHLLKLNLSLLMPILCVTASGYDLGLFNGLLILPQFFEYFDEPSSPMISVLICGLIFGALLGYGPAVYLCDHVGRKKAILVSTVGATVFVVLQAASQNYAMLLAFRILIAAFGISSTIAGPLLVSELAYPTHRGVVTAVYNTFNGLGGVVVSCITYGTYHWTKNSSWSWRMPIAFQCLFPLIQLALYWYTPESPRYLVKAGKLEEARNMLIKWHAGGNLETGGALVEFEFAEICKAIHGEEIQKKSQFSEFVKSKANFHRLCIVVILSFTMQMSGNGLTSYYLTYVLGSIGVTNPSTQLVYNIAITVYSLGVSVIFGVMAGRLPRRRTFLFGLSSMLVCFIIWTALSAVNVEKHFLDKSLSRGVLAMIFLVGAAYSVALSGLPFLYLTEILPFHLRAKGMVIFSFVGVSCSAYNGFVNNIAILAIGWKYYILFCCILVIEILAVYFVFPETYGYTLEETAVVFGDDPVLPEGSKDIDQ
jgi:sugar porter (SP) family MFS transporter